MLRRCLDCQQVTTGSRCSACERQRDKARGTRQQRGYDNLWQQARLHVLARDCYLCYWCGMPANTADHIIPLAHGGARLDPDNIVAACLSCNSSRGGQLAH